MSDSQEKSNQDFGRKKKPFKLCFAPHNLIGRSNIQIGKPLQLANIITPKFYCKYEVEQTCSDTQLNKQIDYLDIKGPREKYVDPMTENQRYGWYQHAFTDLDKYDRRLHFTKQTSAFVKEHLMNYANIR